MGGCFNHKISTKPVKTKTGIDFNISSKNINGLLGIVIWEEVTRKTLWEVKLNYYNGQTITYGLVPKFNKLGNSAKQTWPLNNKHPENIPKNKNIYVCIAYQYDEKSSPSSKRECFSFKINNQKNIIDITKRKHPSLHQQPDLYLDYENK